MADAVPPGPEMDNPYGFWIMSVCARAVSGVLKQTTAAANASRPGRGVNVRNVFSGLDLKSVHNDHTTGFPLKQATALMCSAGALESVAGETAAPIEPGQAGMRGVAADTPPRT